MDCSDAPLTEPFCRESAEAQYSFGWGMGHLMSVAHLLAWKSWTTYYDSVNQEPTMVMDVSGDGTNVRFLLDRLAISLEGEDVPLAGSVGLSGELSGSASQEFLLRGFELAVEGYIDKTSGSDAVLTCSIGPCTHYLEWLAPTHATATRIPLPGEDIDEERESSVGSDFQVECFTSAALGHYNPDAVGATLPLPPLPVTVTMHARRASAEEKVFINVPIFGVTALR
jgi:hypothetical protein